MPARVHAIIVARPGDPARTQLLHTLDALHRQTVPVSAVTVVVTGSAAALRRGDSLDGIVEGIVEARSGTSFAEAVAMGQQRADESHALWLLAQDTAPAPDALAHLAGALERSPSALIAAPKLVSLADDREIVSLGVSMSRYGRTVELASGELDQGQHDGIEDALAADIRGMLIRAEVRPHLRPDPALGGMDEGLDLGVRARLGGGRVVLVPQGRVGVAPDGPAAPPRRDVPRAWASRQAQLHRRLAYAPAAAVPLHWLTLLPLALWRTIVHLIAKRPAAVGPEWGAAIVAMVRLPSVARSRAAIRGFRSATWASIAPLRVTRDQLRQRLDDGYGSEGGAVSELNFFAGGAAWAVIAAFVVGLTAFTSLLAWPVLGGGGLLPLRDTLTALWSDAAWGPRGLGLNLVGPADPFSAVLAVLGSLWPGAPSTAVVLLWLLALPLAVLGGWFAATRVTDRPGLRVLGGVVWALAPTFLTALVQGRPSAVLLHLLLPWVFHSAVVAHRSWGAAGAASLLTAAALACAPSLAPAFALLWVLALIISLSLGRVRGAVRLLWVLIPSAVMFAPLAYWQLQHADPWALLADPAVITTSPALSADAAGRSILAGGFPSADRAGWEWVVGPELAAWAPVLLAPLALLALVAAVSPRWRSGITLLLVTVVGILTAYLAVGVVVSFAQGVGVQIWPGTGLSLAWIGLTGGALVAADTVLNIGWARTSASLLAAVAVVVCAVPALGAVHTGHSALRDGPESTLPAFVAAQSTAEHERATLVLTPLNDGSLSARVVWGSSDTLSAQTTMLSTATVADDELAVVAVDLLSARDFDASGTLAVDGISFVLLAETPGETDRARTLRGSAVTAIDQRAGFVKAGQTQRGTLWRIESETIADRPALSDTQQATMRAVTGAQLLVVLAAILLSIPTRASRRAARSRSRIVGRAPEEPLVLPRRRGAARDDDAADADLDEPEMSAAEPDDTEGSGTSPDAPAPGFDADTTADEHPGTDPGTDPDTDRDAPSTQPEEAR